jgi:hypothetical protein
MHQPSAVAACSSASSAAGSGSRKHNIKVNVNVNVSVNVNVNVRRVRRSVRMPRVASKGVRASGGGQSVKRAERVTVKGVKKWRQGGNGNGNKTEM